MVSVNVWNKTQYDTSTTMDAAGGRVLDVLRLRVRVNNLLMVSRYSRYGVVTIWAT